jgi:glycosyltransferase involved in cell wall biosynthesis
MSDLISICIPTRNRPALLAEAVESGLAQAYRPLELLIGDDSTDERTEEAVGSIQAPAGVTLQYYRNSPPLGQSGNVNKLFHTATGDRLMLLHDDDLLFPQALDWLVATWDAHDDVAAVYGKRYVTTIDGLVIEGKTQRECEMFYLTKAYEGPQDSATVAGLRQQIANDGYLVRTSLARAVGYRPAEVVGRMVDWDFGVRLGLAAEPSKFVYLDRFTIKYRMSEESVARSGLEPANYHLMYENFLTMDLPARHRQAGRDVYARLRDYALRECIYRRDRQNGFRVYFAPDRTARRWSPRGLYYLAAIAFPQVKLWRDRLWARHQI